MSEARIGLPFAKRAHSRERYYLLYFFIFFVSKNDRSPKVDCIVSPVVRRGAKEASGVEPIVEVGNKYFSSFRGGLLGSLGRDKCNAGSTSGTGGKGGLVGGRNRQ